MSAYRHVTNLKTPFGSVDRRFLDVLGVWKIGDPARFAEDQNTVEQMRGYGYVGIYATREALSAKALQDLTGWTEPEHVMGAPYRPFDFSGEAATT